MADRKLFCVLGASGVQGSGVVHAVLTHPTLSQQFRIRALSRNPDSLKDKYASLTADIDYASADIDDLASLKSAFEGAHTVFGLTNYYETRSLDRDVQQGKNVTDACVAVGVKHLVWSSMRFAKDVSDGEVVDAPGLDGKAAVSDYIERVKGTAGMKATHLLVGFYYSNLARIWGYENSEGEFECKFPWNMRDTRVPLVDAAVDVGRFVAGVMVRGGDQMDGKWVQCVTEWNTMQEICDVWSELSKNYDGARGKTMVYEEVSKQVFEDRLPEPLRVEQLGNLVVIIDRFELFGKGARSKQDGDDELVQAAGMDKSSWKEYLLRGFEVDYTQPMFPRFMFPHLAEQDGVMDVKEANGSVMEANGEISPV